MGLFHQLFNAEGLAQLIRAGGLGAVCLIIFMETGIFALLPGDSMLVLCGILAATPGADGQPVLSLPTFLIVIPFCAILGDQVGYWVGNFFGKVTIYSWKDFYLGPLPIYKKDYLLKTEAYYERFGNFTVVAGRWVPLVRTFAPLLAGVVRMPFMTFLGYNVIGAFTWVWSMLLAGYFLPPLLKTLAPQFDLATNIDKIAILIVLLSLLPIVYTVLTEKKAAPAAAPKRKAKTKKARSRA